MITLRGLTKRYGERTAVDRLTLDIGEGKVTGFLGPNGAGKSTTMRMILGLDHPTAGAALLGGRPYAALRHPVREVGALLDAKAVHPARSARAHLVAQARTNGIPVGRVAEVLETVGLARVAGQRAGTFSLGMYQRLGMAGALLGDPRVLVLDEPVNGLDPDGVRWLRQLVRAQADGGRTVFLSSHLMSELQLTADHLVVLGRGKLLADAPMAEFLARGSRPAVRLRTPDTGQLATLTAQLREHAGVQVEPEGPGELVVRGSTAAELGELAHRTGVRLHQLADLHASLGQVYLELTAPSREYGSRTAPREPAEPAGPGKDEVRA